MATKIETESKAIQSVLPGDLNGKELNPRERIYMKLYVQGLRTKLSSSNTHPAFGKKPDIVADAEEQLKPS
jgi:hypothetical protein